MRKTKILKMCYKLWETESWRCTCVFILTWVFDKDKTILILNWVFGVLHNRIYLLSNGWWEINSFLLLCHIMVFHHFKSLSFFLFPFLLIFVVFCPRAHFHHSRMMRVHLWRSHLFWYHWNIIVFFGNSSTNDTLHKRIFWVFWTFELLNLGLQYFDFTFKLLIFLYQAYFLFME